MFWSLNKITENEETNLKSSNSLKEISMSQSTIVKVKSHADPKGFSRDQSSHENELKDTKSSKKMTKKRSMNYEDSSRQFMLLVNSLSEMGAESFIQLPRIVVAGNQRFVYHP